MQSITLVKESDATDEDVREAYREIKTALRLPMVSLLFQAYASTPKFLGLAWRRLRPSVLAPQFAQQAAAIGAVAERAVAQWGVGDHAAALHARSMSAVDLRRLRDIADLFRLLDPKLLIIARAVDLVLSGESINGTGSTGPAHEHSYVHNTKEFRVAPLVLTEERDWPPRVRAIYDEVKSAVTTPFVSNDYRALSAYPDWLEVWWKDTRSLVRDPRYAQVEKDVADAARGAAKALPHRFVMSDELLERNGIDAARRVELRSANGVFVRTLPGLIINMEIARRGLGPEPA
ncbi:MAG: halocarboxylic acid dehydrogenase DehI family protein [Candidatus Eremiobacteraeota bacterium]|nr:halocarboxylic acid dehydrogenase DehI family protein [Candidatus Eremiobacteraeota bacterium]